MEAIVVILIVGILGGVVMLRTDSRRHVSVLTQAEALRSVIAHAQNLAVSRSSSLRLQANSSGVSVCQSTAARCDPTKAMIDPATGSRLALTLTDGVTMTRSGSPDAQNGDQLYFDSIGRPVSHGNVLADNPVASYTLSDQVRTASVTVRPVTGFAEVSY